MIQSHTMMDLDAYHYKNHSNAQYQRVKELIPNCNFHEKAHVLDVGCGDGKITAEIAAALPNGWVLGIDASPNMIHCANEAFQQPNLEFQCIKAEEIFLNKHFDNILCFNCLLWVRKPKEALDRLSKLLKPGGSFLILTYLKESSYVDLLEKALDRFPAYKKLSAAHTMLTLKEHRNILESNKLKINTFEVRNMIADYSTKEDLKNYLKGWLGCYVPLPEELQNEFLNQAVENSLNFSISSDKGLIKLPYKSLIINATK
jgi:trans-aconitate 2-methyltransferase